MQQLGNPEYLKKEIDKAFKERLEEWKKEKLQEFEDWKKSILKAHRDRLSQLDKKLEDEKRLEFATAESDEKRKAKQDFEEKREAEIEKVFDQAKEKAKYAVTKKEYHLLIHNIIQDRQHIRYLGNTDLIKGYDPIEHDPEVTGLKIIAKESVIDLSFEKFIEAKKEVLRMEISNTLFR